MVFLGAYTGPAERAAYLKDKLGAIVSMNGPNGAGWYYLTPAEQRAQLASHIVNDPNQSESLRAAYATFSDARQISQNGAAYNNQIFVVDANGVANTYQYDGGKFYIIDIGKYASYKNAPSVDSKLNVTPAPSDLPTSTTPPDAASASAPASGPHTDTVIPPATAQSNTPVFTPSTTGSPAVDVASAPPATVEQATAVTAPKIPMIAWLLGAAFAFLAFRKAD